MKNSGCLLWTSAIVGIMVASLFVVNNSSNFLCSLTEQQGGVNVNPTSIQLKAILHYATSQVVPQLSLTEINATFNVLQSLNRPANLLVFGLGHDSLMWAGLNPHGKTLFLEDDPNWVHHVLKDAPDLRAHIVRYRTQLREAGDLLASCRSEAACLAATATLHGNERCRLALHDLPDEVYTTEWDVVVIDAPKGYFAEAPGRMAPIFSAAVMARDRKGSGVTHVFLHNGDRKVEEDYWEEFLCRKNLVEVAGKLFHFGVPPMTNLTRAGDASFC